jgi:integrase
MKWSQLVVTMPLTDRAIKAMRSQQTHTFVADSAGLYVRVHPTGTKTFVLRSRRGGKARWLSLGTYPQMSLHDARRAAAERSGRTLPGRTTFKQLFDMWLEDARKRTRRPEQPQQQMERHILPYYGGRSLERLTTYELSDSLRQIARTSPVMVKRVLSTLKNVLNYAVGLGLLKESPVAALRGEMFGKRYVPRDRVLTDDELRRLIAELRSDRFHSKTSLALALMLLTGQRSDEVRGISRAEVGKTLWLLPAHRTKTRKENEIPRSPVLDYTLRLAFKLHGSSPFDGMVGQVPARAMRVIRFDPPATPHDLRRTMATRMADLGVEPWAIEKCLNHSLGGMMAIYNHSSYLAEKKAAYRLWHRYLLALRKNP